MTVDLIHGETQIRGQKFESVNRIVIRDAAGNPIAVYMQRSNSIFQVTADEPEFEQITAALGIESSGIVRKAIECPT